MSSRTSRSFWLAAVGAAMAVFASAQPTPKPPKAPKDRTLCVVSDSGIVRCVRPEILKDELSPGLVQKLHELAEKIWSEHGLAGSSDTAYRCGTGEWKSKRLSLGSPSAVFADLTASRKQRPTLPSATDQTNMVSDCQTALRASVSAGGWGGVGGGRGSRGSWVQSSVATMDKAVAGCRDDRNRNSMVSWSTQPSDLLNEWESAKGKVLSKFDRDSMQATVTIIEHQLGENRAKKFAAAAEGDRKELAALEKEKSWLMELLQQVIGEASEWPKGTLPPGAAVTPGHAPPSPPPANPTPLGPPATPGRNPTPVPSGTGTPCEQGEGCKPSCEQIQAMWDAFKADCEQSDWQVYRCEAFLRTLNGCVDPALINPGPDGDLTCPERAKTTKAEKAKLSFLAACEKSKMIATPVGDGGIVCIAPELDALPPGIDICNDPRVMPGPDQCFGGNVPDGGDRPRPQPNPRG